LGRYYWRKKATVEESCDLTIFQLRKWGMLQAGLHTATVITWVMKNTGKETRVRVEVNMTGEPYVKLTYFVYDREGNTTTCASEADLITTPCNLGGVRYWFACPECGQHVGGLYLVPGGIRFRCRQCSNLTYRSRNRGTIGSFGDISRHIDKLRGEIKRWTWRGRPTRKVRKLRALERKMGILSAQASAMLDKLTSRIHRHSG
jgi:hypothetical protein